MADNAQLERLTALLAQQSEQAAQREERLAEQAAQREERLATMLERALANQEFGTWRQKFDDFRLLTHLETLPIAEQKAALMSLLDDEWTRTLRYSLQIPSEADLKTVIDTMEAHLRGQRSIILDRRDFYSRVQEPDETFDDFVSSIKEIAAYCDFCDKCADDQYRDRIVVGIP
ncbi:hypothetical protein FJT64_025760 [Amphibalanus amphitrite]|uniref:Uncharacterized protein n=1 Tax=Amphibalanus amphitrite TaxID=1232801 RepID=A0A6A4WJQ0_AMPAM|nr:hypothetical protein FJT64_025760 [Amphibalanus amphitrite]